MAAASAEAMAVAAVVETTTVSDVEVGVFEFISFWLLVGYYLIRNLNIKWLSNIYLDNLP